jgi:hypothetical protein
VEVAGHREGEVNKEGEPTMKHILTKTLSVVAILAAMSMVETVRAETIETRIGKLSFTHDFANGYPTKETVQKLYDERDFQRACQLYLWALPIVAFAQGQEQARTLFGAGELDLFLANGYQEVSGILTPNVVTPYMGGSPDLAKTGPLVIEVPAGPMAGLVNDFWQRPVSDLGLAGPDQGKGGRFLLLGPGQTVPQTEGFIVVNSSTLNVSIFIRNLETDPGKAERLQKQFRFYPYAQRENPPVNHVRGSEGKKYSQTQPRGLAYWERLADILNREPVQERDRIMMAMLRPLGIEKDKPFRPDERQKKILTDAALVGEAMARANDFDKRQMELSHYKDGVQWHLSLCLDPSQEAEFYTQLDERAAWFYEAATTSKGMVTKTPGLGQVYLGSYKDKGGNWLDGANTYRLHVPPNAPVKQFWSLTIYEVDTRSLIQNRQQIADRSSRQPDLVKNADGSMELYVGPAVPKGFEKNWIPSVPGRAWFAYFRLYAPTEAHFNRTWTLPDFEKVK